MLPVICSRVVSVLDSGAEGPGFQSQSRRCLRQTVHTHCASVHQAAKLVAVLLRVAGVPAGLAESNGSLPPGSWLTSPAGWLPRTGISSGTLRSVIEYGLPLPFYYLQSPSTASGARYRRSACIDMDMLRLAAAACCDTGWISAQTGVLCDWSVSKKTGSMY